MRTSSAKAKGKLLCLELRDMLLGVYSELSQDDIRVTPNGVPGPDLLFSPRAKELIPFVYECKNQESLNIWAALKQSESHAKSAKEIPILVFRRNRSDSYLVGKAETLIKLLRNISPGKGCVCGAGIPEGVPPTGIPDPAAHK